jgi:hypothetical protein
MKGLLGEKWTLHTAGGSTKRAHGTGFLVGLCFLVERFSAVNARVSWLKVHAKEHPCTYSEAYISLRQGQRRRMLKSFTMA